MNPEQEVMYTNLRRIWCCPRSTLFNPKDLIIDKIYHSIITRNNTNPPDVMVKLHEDLD